MARLSIFPLNDLWCAVSAREKYLLQNEYGYSDKDIVITGLPRFDFLADSSDQSKWQNMILYMPTFRDIEKDLEEKCKDTELYRRIKDLMLDKQLNLFLQEKDCSIFPLNDLWCAVSAREKYLLQNEYGYSDKDIVITGLPRFDFLADSSDQSKWQNMILYMPTFRDIEKDLEEKCKDTELYRRIKDLMLDKQLNLFLQEKDCR